MSRPILLLILGIALALLPFSGLPVSWSRILLPVIGVVVALIGVSLKASWPTPPSHEADPEAGA